MFLFDRTNIICPNYWNGYDNSWAKWWPISCFAHNCWWTGKLTWLWFQTFEKYIYTQTNPGAAIKRIAWYHHASLYLAKCESKHHMWIYNAFIVFWPDPDLSNVFVCIEDYTFGIQGSYIQFDLISHKRLNLPLYYQFHFWNRFLLMY